MRLITMSLIVVFYCGGASAGYIPWETVSGVRHSSPYFWGYSYDIGFFDGAIRVNTNIDLGGADPGEYLMDRWEFGIEDTWSTDRFDVPITFDIDWYDQPAHQTVQVHEGYGGFTMLDWYTMRSPPSADGVEVTNRRVIGGFDHEGIAAHEYGHMLGLWDEYPSGAVNPEAPRLYTGGLMHTTSGETLDYYYDDILSWYESSEVRSVPTPATLFLLLPGMALAFASSRRIWRRLPERE